MAEAEFEGSVDLYAFLRGGGGWLIVSCWYE